MVYFCAMALLTRTARRFGMDTARPLASVGRYRHHPIPPWPEGSISSGWSMSDPDTPSYALELTTPVEQQLEWLARCKAPYLRTQPSGALAIAHSVTPQEGRALGIETVLLNGETVPDGAREIIAERLARAPPGSTRARRSATSRPNARRRRTITSPRKTRWWRSSTIAAAMSALASAAASS
jgi:hypothetical protein